MTPVTIAPDLLAQLTGEEVPLADAAGKPVGYFLTAERFALLEALARERLTGEVALAEFRRALANPRRHSMADVLKLVEGE
jgi:acetyl-CoA acetyltransferase